MNAVTALRLKCSCRFFFHETPIHEGLIITRARQEWGYITNDECPRHGAPRFRALTSFWEGASRWPFRWPRRRAA